MGNSKVTRQRLAKPLRQSQRKSARQGSETLVKPNTAPPEQPQVEQIPRPKPRFYNKVKETPSDHFESGEDMADNNKSHESLGGGPQNALLPIVPGNSHLSFTKNMPSRLIKVGFFSQVTIELIVPSKI
jgi:hypothetical protein